MRTTISEDETILYEGGLHWIILVSPAIQLAVGLSLMFAVLSLNVHQYLRLIISFLLLFYSLFKAKQFITLFLERRYATWLLTDSRFIGEWGVLRKQVKEIFIEKIQDVSYSTNVPGRMLNYGYLTIECAGPGGPFSIDYIEDPEVFSEAMVMARSGFVNTRDTRTDKITRRVS